MIGGVLHSSEVMAYRIVILPTGRQISKKRSATPCQEEAQLLDHLGGSGRCAG